MGREGLWAGSWDLSLPTRLPGPRSCGKPLVAPPHTSAQGAQAQRGGGLLKVTQHVSPPRSWARVSRACPSAPGTHDAHLSGSRLLTRWALHRWQAT